MHRLLPRPAITILALVAVAAAALTAQTARPAPPYMQLPARLPAWHHLFLTVGPRVAPLLADGRTFLTVIDRRIALIDAATSSRLDSGENLVGENVSVVALSPNGRFAAFGGSHITIAELDGRHSVRIVGTLLRQPLTPYAHPEEIQSLAFSHDGRRLAAAGPLGIEVFDLSAASRIAVVDTGYHGGISVEFAGDDATLVAAHSGGAIVLFDAGTWRQRAVIDADTARPLFEQSRYHSDLIADVAPHANTVIGVWRRGRLAAYDVATAALRWQVAIDEAEAESPPVTASPDGALVAVSGCDGVVELRWVADGAIYWRRSLDAVPASFQWTPDGTTLLVGCRDAGPLAISVRTGAVIEAIGSPCSSSRSCVAFGNDDSTILVASNLGTVAECDARSGKQRRRVITHAAPIGIAPNPATGATEIILLSSERYPTRTLLHASWTAAGDVNYHMLGIAPHYAWRAVLSPDCEQAAIACDSALVVADLLRDTIRRVIEARPPRLMFPLRTTGGARLAAMYSRDTTTLIDPTSGDELAKLRFGFYPRICCTSPDGAIAALFSSDSVILLDRTGRRIAACRSGIYPGSAAFSADGTWLAAGDERRIVIWSVTDLVPLHHLLKPQRAWRGATESIAFAPDRSRIVACTEGGELVMWQLGDGHVPIAAQRSRRQEAAARAGVRSGSVGVPLSTPGFAIPQPATKPDWQCRFRWYYPQQAQLLGDDRTMLLYNDDSVFLWDAAAERERTLAPIPSAATVAIDAHRRLAAISSAGRLTLYDALRGDSLRTCAIESWATAHHLVFSRDGRRLYGEIDRRGIAVWDVTTGRHVARLDSTNVEHEALAVSPDGKYLAAMIGGSDSLRLLDAATGAIVRFLPGAHGAPHGTARYPVHLALAFTPNGRTLAAAGTWGQLRLWNVRRGTLERTVDIPQAEYWPPGISISPDGRFAAIAANAPEVQIIALATGRIVRRLAFERRVRSCAFTRDGTALMVAGDDGRPSVVDARTGRARYHTDGGHDRAIAAVAFAARRPLVASMGTDGYVEVRDRTNGRLHWRADVCGPWMKSYTPCVAFRKGDRRDAGEVVAVAGGLADGGAPVSLRVERRSARDGTLRRRLELRLGHSASAALTSNGEWMVIATDTTVLLYKVASMKQAFATHVSRGIQSTAASEDGTRIAIALSDSSVIVIAPAGGGVVQRLSGVGSYAGAVRFLPANDGVLIAGSDGQLRLWRFGSDTASVLAIVELIGSYTFEPRSTSYLDVGPGTSMVFDRSGRWMVAATSLGGLVWDTHTWRCTRVFAHDKCTAATIAPDGTGIATAGEAGDLRIWRTQPAPIEEPAAGR